MDLGLAGRVALVTGGSKGIGLGIATELAAEGARVAVAARDPERVREAAERIGGHGVAFDSADLDAVPGVIAEVESALGPIDVYVANTGGPPAGPDPLAFTREQWEAAHRTLVLSPMAFLERLLPGMRERGWGRVQFLASDSAVVISEEMVHYGVTKTALLGVSRGYAKAMAGTGVTVNAVMAGPTHTEGVETFARSLVGDDLPWEEAQRRFMREHRPNSLLQRLIEPEEIANMVAYLSSDLASATTGGALRVDGGYVDNIVP
jgi:NAD(P)-dependent dehydrogenase (short-subunit alcohol dehydrogenase family)